MPDPLPQDRLNPKEFLRRLAVEIAGAILQLGSRPYQAVETPAVFIAPHPDDESLGCGGIIARKRNEGLPVHVVFITDGSASHPGHPRFGPAELAALRRGEARRALACLGVERTAIHFLDEPDGSLKGISAVRREALVARLADLFRRIAPGEVFLPCCPDGSSEHNATHGFVLEAVARSGTAPTVWQYPVWSWWNPVLLLRGWFATRDCRALPLEDYQQAKRQAIRCYQSQIAPLPPDTSPALPPSLIAIFRSDTEFFFRHELPRPPA
jgi:LmbE family N-acetylglucosaminyl deacetylase